MTTTYLSFTVPIDQAPIIKGVLSKQLGGWYSRELEDNHFEEIVGVIASSADAALYPLVLSSIVTILSVLGTLYTLRVTNMRPF